MDRPVTTGRARGPDGSKRGSTRVSQLFSKASRTRSAFIGRVLRPTRRGVVSVLAMMFLVLFGSLVAAMAIASQGNIRAASTHLHVVRSMGAAETGLAIGEQRLREAASRFVVSRSEMDPSTVWSLWTGDTAGLGDIDILPPPSGHPESSPPSGIAEAIALIHAADENIVVHQGVDSPYITSAPTGTDTNIYMEDGWVLTPVIALDEVSGPDVRQPAFQIMYAPLANGTDVRVIAIGYDFGYERQGRPLTRVITRDYQIVKRVEHAVISPTRILIGKNVHVTGDLGARFEDVSFEHGDPIVMRSDFYGLDPILDQKLDDLYEGIAMYDVDGDNRLRIGHPIESLGIPDNGGDYTGDGQPDHAFRDATGDGYVDEFDVFINHFDADGDGRVVLSPALTAGTPAEGMTPEFVDANGDPIDDDLAYLIDSHNPDRNRNNVYGYIDKDNTGRWDHSTDDLLDYDPSTDTYPDRELGYLDGVIDALDRYAKVRGSLAFSVDRATWEEHRGDWTQAVQGAIRPRRNNSPVSFNVDEDKLPRIGPDSFATSRTALQDIAASGINFEQQVADQLGVSVGDLETYEETKPDGTDQPRFFRLDPDTTGDGRPDNWQEAHFERMPFNSPNFADWYYRPVYENMVFKNVEIPKGTNALFINCTFAGVTWVRTHTGNTHPLWTIYGQMQMDNTSGRPRATHSRWVYGDDPGETGDDAPPMLPPSAIPPQQNILIADSPLDKGDVLESQISMFTPAEYDKLPEPLVIDGKRVVDTKKFSNNIRFHDCTFVGSLVSDTTQNYTHVRNKIQFTGATRFVQEHPEHPNNPAYNPEPEHLPEIAKSSIMVPHYSVDIGTFNSPPEQNVQLRGTIIAGVLDIRGNAVLEGALLLTFRPEHGQPPLVDVLGNPVGNPSNFNCAIGYFGPDDGDMESLDPRTLPLHNGKRIVGWDVTGDGLADVSPFESQPDGSTPVPFHGYGRIELRFDPLMELPDGIMLPLQVSPRAATYREGSL